jgi:predicted AlkP superfamily phosphohydrolase/phosphomutase
MPALAALIARGVRLPLRSDPPMISPAIWTTIATGKRREKHGISWFTMTPPSGGGEVLVNSHFRKTAALWNILDVAGRRVNVVGWWATWPPERVNGVVVSDRTARERFADWAADAPLAARSPVSPEELAPEIDALVARPDSIDRNELRQLADFTDDEIERIAGATEAILYDGFSVTKFAWQAEKSYARIGEHLLRTRPADLTAVFLVAIDPVSHGFWQFHEPAAFTGVDPEVAKRLGPVVANAYVAFDRHLASLVAAAGKDATVIVCSDHGFRASGKPTVPYETQSGEHDEAGLFVAAGPAIRPLGPDAARGLEPTVFDVAPTVLAILGLPAARDMDGRVLEEILSPEFARAVPRAIESWDRRWSRTAPLGAASSSPADAAYVEQLRALGYIR